MADLSPHLMLGDAALADTIAHGWIADAVALIDQHGAVVRASLIGVKGSAPREAGTMMLITANAIFETIGGGSLEFEVMAAARAMIETHDHAADTNNFWQRQVISAALGPDMGQCCGGHVRVLLELLTSAEREHLATLATVNTADGAAVIPKLITHPLRTGAALSVAPLDAVVGLTADKSSFMAPLSQQRDPLFLYGAGHIGRALVAHLVALEFDVHWVDVARERFPSTIPPSVHRIIAADPVIIAKHAPEGAMHLVITHNHALDEAICYQLLAGAGFARLGLIGSATKAARFRSRLAKAGISKERLDGLVCPVGLAAITGKAPARVALSIAANVAIWQQEHQHQHNNNASASLD